MMRQFHNDVWEKIKKWNFKDVKNFYSNVRKLGLKALTPDGSHLSKFLSDLLKLSSKGLENRKIFLNGKNESIFLEPLDRILESGLSPAETWKNLFLSEWKENIDNIYGANYFNILKKMKKYNSLNEIRKKIDEVDIEILNLISERKI